MTDPHDMMKEKFPDPRGFKAVKISVRDCDRDVDGGTAKLEKNKQGLIDLYTAVSRCLERNDALNREFR